MRELTLFILFLFPIVVSAQLGIHNTSLTIKSNFVVSGDISGSGEINISTGVKFKSGNVDCSIKMNHLKSKIISYTQNCDCTGLEYNLFDMTGKFLRSGIFSENELMEIGERHFNTPLIFIFSDKTVKKIFIKK
ncbi:hypothetical protein [Aquimarina macrocephali]|uniref:hypothetical protein n=1 Tax=Aquimarina macrocephali TaxID=666563 RepID=UPI003F67C32E